MNRRNFLAAAAAGTLASTIPHAFGAASEKLRIGVIGTGLRGQVHIAELLKRADVELAAICDLDASMLTTAARLIEKAGKSAPTIFTGSDNAWQEMVDRHGWDENYVEALLRRRRAIAALQQDEV